MTIHPLSDDSPIRDQILPAVWGGYRLPVILQVPEGAIDFISKVIEKGCHVPQEIADKISKDYYLGNVHDFCVSYLGRNLTDADHAKILLIANEFIKKGTIIKIDENEKDLIKLLAVKVVINAHQRANQAMSNACFLNEQGRLPKENIFMLQKGTSPVFYNKDEFERAETLKKDVHGVPDDRLFASFTNWLNYFGMRYDFNQIGHLLGSMRYTNALILKKTAQTYLMDQRHPRRRERPAGRVWRGREG